MKNDDLTHEISQRLKPLAKQLKVNISLRSLISNLEPFEQPADSELVKVAERLTGYSADAVAFATEGPLLQKLGMQTVVMGPGSIDQAHQPDEYMALNQLTPAIELLKQLIRQFCL